MDPTVVAAIIAAAVSVLTLVGTLAAQYLGRRATSRDTKETLERQREQLDLTLAEQSKQLDRTLAVQSKQLDLTLAEQRTRTLNERFATAADQLGSDKPVAVRLAGVYAMAGLADDWDFSKANQQTCVNVLSRALLRRRRAGVMAVTLTGSDWYHIPMEAVVDQAGRIVLPKYIRDALGLLPGTKVDISPYGAGVQVVPTGRTARLVDEDGVL